MLSRCTPFLAFAAFGAAAAACSSTPARYSYGHCSAQEGQTRVGPRGLLCRTDPGGRGFEMKENKERNGPHVED